MESVIRIARKEDLFSLTEIYNEAVIHTTATLDLEPRTMEEREHWMEEHNKGNHPLIVAVKREEDEEEVVGYASLSTLFEKDAYVSSVELSIYVHPKYQRQGIGDRLMGEILSLAKTDDTIHTVVSKITAGNEASEKLHEKYGFVKVGTLRECAWKFDRLLDMDMYQLMV